MQGIAFLLISAFCVLLAGIWLGLFFRGIDRKLAAWYQSRIGPPLLQPFYDLRKLMMKQTIVPENAVPWIFRGAPLLALVSSVVLLFYIWLPYFSFLAGIETPIMHSGDIILIMYILMISAIALITGGFVSGSPYSAVGAQREMVILMSVELPLAVTAITFGWKMSVLAPAMPSFSLATIAGNPLWHGMGPLGILGGMLLILTLVAAVPAELAKIPFDQAEADTEIAEGLLAEYSGRFLAFFTVADAVKTLAMISLVVILFFPHGIEALTGAGFVIRGFDLTLPADILLFLVKIFVFYFITVTTVRIAMARLKIAQVSRIFLAVLTLVSLSGYVLIYFDPVIASL